MNILPTIIVAAALACSASQALCGDKIEGAFGMKLGEVFDTAKAERVGPDAEDGDGDSGWFPNNTKPVTGFYRFYVFITPVTHKIYRIIGETSATEPEERKVLEKALKDKYDTTVPSKLPEYLKAQPVIYQANRDIITVERITGGGYIGAAPVSGRVFLKLIYTDRELQKLAKKEEAESKFKGNSGL